jgi:anhydro-N-acetylmuramic acid kinase
MNLATQRGWSIRDVLCTATHLVAETIALVVRQHLPQDAKIDEVLITGGGEQNGMLLREIAMRLPRVPLARIGDLGLPSEAVGAAAAAILALLHVDQVPANRPEITGADTARVLGRLTPGSPQNWQRLLAEMATCRPAARCLRSAL